ncbi:MAG TPA: HU family DNA-binding protein [bacterium]|nr:HU family DNA-binding protein [bacterium]
MLKKDLVLKVAEKGGRSKRAAGIFVNFMFDAMINALLREERIAIRNFGNFTVRHYGGYTSINPKSGERIAVPAKRLPYFRAGKDLLKRINHSTGGPA